MKVYLAADHAGVPLKNFLVDQLKKYEHFQVEDCGALTLDPADDYPPIIAAGAKRLSHDSGEGIDSKLIVIGGSGQGEAIVANRFKGVRCALYYGEAARNQTDMSGKSLNMLESTRQHNNANAISLGARFLTEDEALAAVLVWLDTPFPNEERHARRIKMIDEQ